MMPNWRGDIAYLGEWLVRRFPWISTTKVMLRGVSYLLYTYQNEIAVKYVFSFKFFFHKMQEHIFPPGDSDFVDLTLMHFIFFVQNVRTRVVNLINILIGLDIFWKMTQNGKQTFSLQNIQTSEFVTFKSEKNQSSE